MSNSTPMNEIKEFYKETSESFKVIFDLTSRIDERIKFMIEKYENLENEISETKRNHLALSSIVESFKNKNEAQCLIFKHDTEEYSAETIDFKKQIKDLEDSVKKLNNVQENKIKWAPAVSDLVFKIIYGVVIAYLFWRFNLSVPNLP